MHEKIKEALGFWFRISHDTHSLPISYHTKCHVCQSLDKDCFSKDPKQQFWFCSEECYNFC